MKGKVKCTCGWSWNKSDSSKKDMYICHECGRDNSNNIPKAQEGIKSPNVWAQEQHFQQKKKQDEEYEKLIGNTGEEAIDIVQRFVPGIKYYPGLGSTFAVGEAEANNQDPALSDELGMIPLLPAQTASLMLLYAEKEGENIRKFNENKYRGKDLSELAPEEDVNNRVIDKTYVPKPKIGELKETKKETKSKKVPYTEKKEINKVEIDNTRTVKPQVNTNYKPKSKPETKYKFDIPSITYSDKSFVMPREVNNTEIDNTYVAKPRRKNGGWLDSYADGGTMQEHQENYNNSQASAPEGMVGDGFSNVGRNYSPAWGGQFQDGGNVSDEDYNMKRALELGYTADESGHWPSVDDETGEWLKSKKHHTRGMEIMAYELNPELRNKYNLIENEKGKLQYVPKLQKIEEYQMGGNVYPVNYVPQAQEGIKTYSYPLRDKLYPGEDEYFKAHPEVGGMAAEDNQVIINPYSPLSDEEKNAIRMNETARLAMRNGYARPTFELTPEQKEAFKNYSTDEQDQRETIIGRILSGDPSAKNVTPEQKKYAEELQKVLKFQMGGSIPGAVGFTYARTNDPAPSEGPYAKKTMASAQNGKEMKYYQEGLDWKPKTISKNGGWLDGYDEAQEGKRVLPNNRSLQILTDIQKRKTPEPVGPYRTNVNLDPNSSEYANAYKDNNVFRYDKNSDTYIGRELPELVLQGKPKEKGFWSKYVDNVVREHQGDGPLGAIIGTPLDAIFGLPSKALMYGLTGKVQRPSQAMKLNNPVESLIADIGADPLTYVGGQIFTGKNPITGLRNLKNINAEGKIFSGMNNELNNMAIQNTERYMAKRTPSTSTLSPEMEPYVSRYTKLSDEPYIPYQEDEYIKWFNEQKAKMNPPVVKQDPRSILRRSSVIDINDVEPTKFNFIKQDLSEGNNIKYSFTNEQGNNIATFSGRKSPEGIYVNSIEVNPEFRRQGVASDIYKNIAKELQSKNEGTLFSRSGQHQFTDRDELGRSIAPANKLWENLVNKGEAEKFVEGMSHTYKINPLKQGGIIKDDMGQWAHPGEITEINSNDITMEGVPYDVLGISDTGDTKLMKPGKNYKFKGKKVTEFPMAKNGLRQEQKGLVNLDNLLNFTNYNKPQPGGWLSKYE